MPMHRLRFTQHPSQQPNTPLNITSQSNRPPPQKIDPMVQKAANPFLKPPQEVKQLLPPPSLETTQLREINLDSPVNAKSALITSDVFQAPVQILTKPQSHLEKQHRTGQDAVVEPYKKKPFTQDKESSNQAKLPPLATISKISNEETTLLALSNSPHEPIQTKQMPAAFVSESDALRAKILTELAKVTDLAFLQKIEKLINEKTESASARINPAPVSVNPPPPPGPPPPLAVPKNPLAGLKKDKSQSVNLQSASKPSAGQPAVTLDVLKKIKLKSTKFQQASKASSGPAEVTLDVLRQTTLRPTNLQAASKPSSGQPEVTLDFFQQTTLRRTNRDLTK